MFMEELLWKKKSRVQWLNEGDNNTKFFHKMASCRESSNWIHYLRVEDGWVVRDQDIRLQVERFFHKLYFEDWGPRPKVDGIQFPQIFEGQRCWLERPFSEEEVKGEIGLVVGD